MQPPGALADDGEGHHAGFQWAQEDGRLCPGDGQPIDEGCEEYYNQRRRFEACEAAKRSPHEQDEDMS
jgi:hypothetical protein